jgi:hypothetical protein
MDRLMDAVRRFADYTVGTAIVLGHMVIAARLEARASDDQRAMAMLPTPRRRSAASSGAAA